MPEKSDRPGNRLMDRPEYRLKQQPLTCLPTTSVFEAVLKTKLNACSMHHITQNAIIYKLSKAQINYLSSDYPIFQDELI